MHLLKSTTTKRQWLDKLKLGQCQTPSTYQLHHRFHEMLIVSSLQKNLILSDYSRSCGIDLGDFYVTIGGQSLDGNYTGLRMVTKYSQLGQSEDLPQLQTGRYHLGCSSYMDSNGDQVRMADLSITDKKNIFPLRFCW